MSSPRIMLATICLNEMEWLEKLYQQHKDWLGLVKWVFVEGADAAYAEANPELVKFGLSADGTTEFLEELARKDDRVVHVKHGTARHYLGVDQGKVPLRNRYLEAADAIKPDWIIAIDADEFYTLPLVGQLSEMLGNTHHVLGACFRQREVWWPPSCSAEPLFSREVIGGLWRMHHCKCWRWSVGMRHRASHVWPETYHGALMNRSMARYDLTMNSPEYVHLGWASQVKTRTAKTRYYHARGEGKTDGRSKWMQCRDAWLGWKPGDLLPHGARVIPYTGPIPECFQ